MKELTDCVKGYVISHEAWYSKNKGITAAMQCPQIEVGMYFRSGGTMGEFLFVWEEFGIRLKAFDDSWQVLGKMPELIRCMVRISHKGKKITIKEFAEQLKRLGYEDLTERVQPKTY